jgi:transcription antitermination factor NusG
MTETLQWYAITVQHQHERAVESALGWKKLETLVPLYRSRRRWSDRAKEILLPLLSGYVLCRFKLAERVSVLNTPGVRSLVGFGGTPAAIDEREIADIRTVSESGLGLGPWPYLKAGDRVRVERGPLRGVEGTLLREPDRLRLIVTVELLQRAMAVELDADMIVPAHLFRAQAV